MNSVFVGATQSYDFVVKLSDNSIHNYIKSLKAPNNRNKCLPSYLVNVGAVVEIHVLCCVSHFLIVTCTLIFCDLGVSGLQGLQLI